MIFKDHLLKGQEWSILLYRRLSKQCMKPTWMYRELLTELKHKKKTCNSRKQEQSVKEQCRTTQACRDGLKKAKVWL